jgi:CPA1 family monovalent cation:H+ antiporter
VIGATPLGAVQAFTALVGGAILVALVARRIGIPYSLALVVFGLIVAALAPLHRIEISPELVLVVLLPGLVFEGAFQTDLNELRRTFSGITLLAVPGVLVSAGIVAVVLHFAAGLSLELGFVVGAIVSATDPVAVIATFKRLGTPRRLATLVEGESLFNDGTAIVVFAIALRAVESPISVWDGVVSFVLTVVISVAIGAAAGFLASRLLARVDDHLIELTISLFVAYGTYLVADVLGESGVIATVVAGIALGSYGRRIGMSARAREVIDVVWEFLSFLLTTLTFILVGLAISLPSLGQAVLPIAWGVAAVLVARALVSYVLVGGTARLVRGRQRAIPAGWLHVLFWSGLRGAVAVALALSLPADFPQRALLQEIAFGIVLFTLLVQGMTIDGLVRRVLTGDRSAAS